MRILDLFSGPDDARIPGGWHNIWRANGHHVTTLDNGLDGHFTPTFVKDILTVDTLADLEQSGRFDVVFASPPCTAFSVAAMGKNWERYMGVNPVNGRTEWLIKGPKHERAERGMVIAKATFDLIDAYAPRWYVIENPISALRVMPFVLGRKDRRSTWYCQWDDVRPGLDRPRAKPTDIWTNVAIDLPMCGPGRPDHEAAPRGAKTGTQGLKNARERSRVPARLAEAFYLKIA